MSMTTAVCPVESLRDSQDLARGQFPVDKGADEKCREHRQGCDFGGGGNAKEDPSPNHDRNKERPESADGRSSYLMERKFLFHG